MNIDPVVSAAGTDEIFQHLQRLDSPEQDVQIWMAHLDSLGTSEIENLSASLDAVESARAAKFRSAQDRQRYCAAHGLLRYLLGATLGCAAAEINFDHSRNGKPGLRKEGRHGRKLHFNLSHSNDWAVFALSWDRDLGIDLESDQLLPIHPEELSRLAARVFSKCELAEWRALTDEKTRRPAFLRAWTRKEAYLKATGEGLRRELADIDDIPPGWVVHDLKLDNGFAGAVAVEVHPP